MFVFFFIFVTDWWINLHFYMILYNKKPIAHDVLPDETPVEKQYAKLKVTPDKIAITFLFQFGSVFAQVNPSKRVKRKRNVLVSTIQVPRGILNRYIFALWQKLFRLSLTRW